MRRPPVDDMAGGEAGFTIVEALLVVTLLSLLSVLAFEAIRFTGDASQRSREFIERIDRYTHAESFLRRAITLAKPKFVSLGRGDSYVQFEGGPARMTFLTAPPRSLSESAGLQLTFSVEPADDGVRLLVKTGSTLSPEDEGGPVRGQSLLPDLKQARFSYYGRKGREAPAWHDEWVRQASLPQLVRIDIEADGGPDRPPIVIRPKIDVDLDCVHDALTKGCRGR